MSLVLENSEITVKVKPLGAELSSIVKNDNKMEYLWNADPTIWNRHAPILFPIVGRLVNNRYTVDSQEYSLSQHGFARDMEFQVVQSNLSAVIFKLQYSEETLKKFPYKFSLLVKYTLDENSIQISYQVKNEDSKEMLFSIGAHPGFNCPVSKDESYEDYYLEFEKEEDLTISLLKEGLLSGETESFGKNIKTIDLKPSLFDKDALIFKNLKSSKIALKSKKNTYSVEMDIPSFPYLGIWTKPGTSSFICLEPWFGVADHYNSKGDFAKKEAIRKLDVDECFECNYTISVN